MSARDALPPDTPGLALYAPGIPEWGGLYLAIYHFAPTPVLLAPKRVPPGWLVLTYGPAAPPVGRVLRQFEDGALVRAAMSSDSLPWSVLQVGGILLLALVVGRAVVSVLLPGGHGWRLERWGWSIAVASLLLAVEAVVSFAVRLRPGWIAFLAMAIGGVVAARRFRLPKVDRMPDRGCLALARPRASSRAHAGRVSIYLVRSLAEPMWSNDFLAIWGLKGKAIFGDAGIPQWLFRWPEFEFSHPGYPIGLPLVYAGIAFLLGSMGRPRRWPCSFRSFRSARCWSWSDGCGGVAIGLVVALAAAAFVANFGVLYSAWLTGMAEVPAAFAFLLLGTALWDVLDDTDPGSVRRLFLASLLAAATKNEGVFLVAVAGALLVFRAARRRERRLWIGAAAVLIAGPGLRPAPPTCSGKSPIRGLDPGLLWRPGLGARLMETLREEWIQLVRPIWPGIFAVIALLGSGGRRPRANPILILVAASLVTYLALPVLCPFGPGWLIHWTVGRIISALVPLLAAGVGMAWCNSEPIATAAADHDRIATPGSGAETLTLG